MASANGHEACVKLLLDAKASVLQATNDGWMSLIVASESGHKGCVTLLI